MDSAYENAKRFAEMGPTNTVGQCNQETASEGRALRGGGCAPGGIRQRIWMTLKEAEHVAERANAARRAKEIIDQHPEFAELLDLIQRF